MTTPCTSTPTKLTKSEPDLTASTEDETSRPTKESEPKIEKPMSRSSAMTTTGTTAYKIEVAAKEGIPPFPPSIYSPNLVHESELRDWLLTKRTQFQFSIFLIFSVINGEKTALLHSKTFFSRIEQTRASLMQMMFHTWTLRPTQSEYQLEHHNLEKV